MLRRRGRPSRFLAAVVFTDIAGSTEVAARLGDEGWKRLLERYQRLIRSALHRFGGSEIDTAGDGLYATFESPAQAITFGAFTCPGFPPYPVPDFNWAAFCDPDVDALALRASGLQASDPTEANRMWAQVDRLIVDQSPAVAAFNPIELSFVSERVGNVQVHPVLAILISQMWVQ